MEVEVEVFAIRLVHLKAMRAVIILGGAAAGLTADRTVVISVSAAESRGRMDGHRALSCFRSLTVGCLAHVIAMLGAEGEVTVRENTLKPAESRERSAAYHK